MKVLSASDLDQQQQLELIIEADIQNEDDAEKHTMFYHYKKSRKIYSQIECDYNANILKMKLSRKDDIDEEYLYDIYYIGLKTLGALMNLMMLYPQWRRLEVIYSDPQHINARNCIKVLVRAYKMYEAQQMIMKIFKLILKRGQLKKSIHDYSTKLKTKSEVVFYQQKKERNVSIDSIKEAPDQEDIKDQELDREIETTPRVV